ncbi:MAG: hypothetical protein Q7R30_21650 [Acidobacteriota bacterium]|nr:hypothetical protein [Acidobacteriota bacterium]
MTEAKRNLGASVAARLLNRSKTTGDDYQMLLTSFCFERFLYGRCLAHFAVDPDLVYVSTNLAAGKKSFLPFNIGKFGGAGNPPVSPTKPGYPTSYLWDETWARDSVLNLIRQFIHEVEEEDDRGKKTGKRFLIFPRYQQLDAVRRLVANARMLGPGRRYLITINWRATTSSCGTWRKSSETASATAPGPALTLLCRSSTARQSAS